jgi:hypothetical protein
MAEAAGPRKTYLVAGSSGGPSALTDVFSAVIASKANAQMSAKDALASSGGAHSPVNLYLCRAARNATRDECSVANDPSSSGLASMVAR